MGVCKTSPSVSVESKFSFRLELCPTAEREQFLVCLSAS